jgi:hypothetical protein
MFEAMMEKMYRGQVSVDCQQLEAMREVVRWAREGGGGGPGGR